MIINHINRDIFPSVKNHIEDGGSIVLDSIGGDFEVALELADLIEAYKSPITLYKGISASVILFLQSPKKIIKPQSYLFIHDLVVNPLKKVNIEKFKYLRLELITRVSNGLNLEKKKVESLLKTGGFIITEEQIKNLNGRGSYGTSRR